MECVPFLKLGQMLENVLHCSVVRGNRQDYLVLEREREREAAGYRECSNEPSVSIKFGEFLD
jgi:hypothetical protein